MPSDGKKFTGGLKNVKGKSIQYFCHFFIMSIYNYNQSYENVMMGAQPSSNMAALTINRPQW
jgi:hypothetical protein